MSLGHLAQFAAVPVGTGAAVTTPTPAAGGSVGDVLTGVGAILGPVASAFAQGYSAKLQVDFQKSAMRQQQQYTPMPPVYIPPPPRGGGGGVLIVVGILGVVAVIGIILVTGKKKKKRKKRKKRKR